MILSQFVCIGLLMNLRIISDTLESSFDEKYMQWGPPMMLRGWGALCVEMGFMWTFPRNQDVTVKLKSELISIKF